MIVYIYTFPNGKKYIGQTINSLSQRAGRGTRYKPNSPVSNAIKKYGWENIIKETIECSSEEEMDKKEKELIALYKTQDREFGYNIDEGGHRRHYCSEETKEKISKSKLGIKKGPLSEATKEKLSVSKSHSVLCVETQKIFGSALLASKYYNISQQGIQKTCSGYQKTSGGYHWIYLD